MSTKREQQANKQYCLGTNRRRYGNNGKESFANLFLHCTSQHLNTLHIDSSLHSLLELFVLTALPTHPDEAAAAGEDNKQRCDADAYHSPVWHYTQNNKYPTYYNNQQKGIHWRSQMGSWGSYRTRNLKNCKSLCKLE